MGGDACWSACGGTGRGACSGAAAEEAQPQPSLVGDEAGGASGEDSSKSETKTEGEAGAGKIEEVEDLLASGSEDHGGGEGNEG